MAMSKLELYLIIRTDMNVDEHERIYHYKKKKKMHFYCSFPFSQVTVMNISICLTKHLFTLQRSGTRRTNYRMASDYDDDDDIEM